MLKFIGCGSAFNTGLGNNCAYIAKDRTLFLIDCGSNIFTRLQEHKQLIGKDTIHVLLSHMHPDHVGSLADLIFYSFFSMGEECAKVTIHAPYSLKIVEFLELQGVARHLYNYSAFSEIDTMVIGDNTLTVTSIPSRHVDTLDSYSYIIDYEDSRIFYSADSNCIHKHILERFKGGEFDKFYQDVNLNDKNSDFHLSFDKLKELIVEPELRSKVTCMHFDNILLFALTKEFGFESPRMF